MLPLLLFLFQVTEDQSSWPMEKGLLGEAVCKSQDTGSASWLQSLFEGFDFNPLLAAASRVADISEDTHVLLTNLVLVIVAVGFSALIAIAYCSRGEKLIEDHVNSYVELEPVDNLVTSSAEPTPKRRHSVSDSASRPATPVATPTATKPVRHSMPAQNLASKAKSSSASRGASERRSSGGSSTSASTPRVSRSGRVLKSPDYFTPSAAKS